MQVFDLNHISKTIQEKGFGYVYHIGSEYILKSALTFILSPWYWFVLKSLPTQMSVRNIIDFVEHDCNKAFMPLQVHSEITSLVKYVKRLQPKVLVEIGTANGGTLLSLVKVSPVDGTFISIDLPGGGFGGGYAFFKIPLYKAFASGLQKMHLLRADSHAISTKQELMKILGKRKIDFLLIDGDHTYEGVKKDFQLYSPLVKKGGSVAFHDIVPHATQLNCKVDQFWKEISTKYPSTTFVEDWKQGVCGIGIVKIN